MLNPTFSRRLLLMLAIETLERPSVLVLIKDLAWPRRTIQDVLKSLVGMGVEVRFITDGVRHNDGYYQIVNWGSVNREWAYQHQQQLQAAVLEQLNR